MSLDTTQAEAAIVSRLITVLSRVYVTEVPDSVTPVYPLVVIYFGDPVRIGTDRGIVSTRNDTQRGFAVIQVQAPTDAAARDIKNKIRVSMVGYRPTDCGEMVLEGGYGYSKAATTVKPTIYYREVGMSWLTNLSYNA